MLATNQIDVPPKQGISKLEIPSTSDQLLKQIQKVLYVAHRDWARGINLADSA